MIHLIVQASKYLMIFLFLVYTFECFHVFKFEGEEEEQKHIYHVQRTLLFLFHFVLLLFNKILFCILQQKIFS